MNPALKQEISVFCESEHPKNIQLLDKIHTVFTAALSPRRKENTKARNKLFPPQISGFAPLVVMHNISAIT